MKLDHEQTLNRSDHKRSTLGRWLAVSALVASASLSAACLPQTSEANASSRSLERRQMYCPPDQPPTTTPRIADLASTSTPTPLEVFKLPSPSPSPSPSPYPGTSTLYAIRTLDCYDINPDTGTRIGSTPTSSPSSPSPSPTLGIQSSGSTPVPKK